MNSYLIDYDLCSPSRNYNSLYDTIKSFPCYAKITESTWFVKTNLNGEQIRDKLLSKIDTNDRIFVGALAREAAWYNVKCDSNFLKKYL